MLNISNSLKNLALWKYPRIPTNEPYVYSKLRLKGELFYAKHRAVRPWKRTRR